MSRVVHCVKLNREAEGLDRPTYPGELGKRIFENVSKEAWQQWLGQQTMLLNEYRLSPMNPKDRKFLEEQMEKFFFGEGAENTGRLCPREVTVAGFCLTQSTRIALILSLIGRVAQSGEPGPIVRWTSAAMRTRVMEDELGSAPGTER